MCFKEFYVVPSKRDTAHFCSRKCHDKYRSIHNRGGNNINWKGGYKSYYGPNWPLQRNKARERDNFACQICGIREDRLPRTLDVHHKIPFREFGIKRYRNANLLPNLLSLCRPCHTTVENMTA
jgi:5-methylcytosine-specific restriction endonuclease McrA